MKDYFFTTNITKILQDVTKTLALLQGREYNMSEDSNRKVGIIYVR